MVPDNTPKQNIRVSRIVSGVREFWTDIVGCCCWLLLLLVVVVVVVITRDMSIDFKGYIM